MKPSAIEALFRPRPTGPSRWLGRAYWRLEMVLIGVGMIAFWAAVFVAYQFLTVVNLGWLMIPVVLAWLWGVGPILFFHATFIVDAFSALVIRRTLLLNRLFSTIIDLANKYESELPNAGEGAASEEGAIEEPGRPADQRTLWKRLDDFKERLRQILGFTSPLSPLAHWGWTTLIESPFGYRRDLLAFLIDLMPIVARKQAIPEAQVDLIMSELKAALDSEANEVPRVAEDLKESLHTIQSLGRLGRMVGSMQFSALFEEVHAV